MVRLSSQRLNKGRQKEKGKQWSFFKIIHPLIIRDQELGIPRRFVRKFAKDLSDVAVLKVPDGKVWDVSLKRTDGEVCFKNGWHDFVEYYTIRAGHFLVFRYNGNSCFYVRLYDTTACEVEYVSNFDNIEETNEEGEGEKATCYLRKQKEVISIDADSSSNEPITSSPQSLPSNGDNNVTRDLSKNVDAFESNNLKFESEHDEQFLIEVDSLKNAEDPTKNIDAFESSGLRSESGYDGQCPIEIDRPSNVPAISSSQPLSSNGGNKLDGGDPTKNIDASESNSLRSESRHGIHSVVKEKEAKQESSVEILYTKTVNNPPVLRRSLRCSVKSNLVKSTSNEPITSGSQPVSQTGTNRSCKSKQEAVGMSGSETNSEPRPPPRRVDWETAIHAAREFKSKNPFCAVTVQPSYATGTMMHIPYRFMKRYASMINYITLVVSNGGSGKAWRCQLIWYNHKRTTVIYNGWNVFVAETNLKEGDACVFELINTEYNVFNVSIFRA